MAVGGDNRFSGLVLQGSLPKEWIGSPHFATQTNFRGGPGSRTIMMLTNSQMHASRQVARTSQLYGKHPCFSSSPPPGIASSTVLRRPGYVALLSSFAFTHFTLAWALVPPIYLFLRQTNLSNSLLAGPQGAWILSRKVPSWVPDVVVDGLAGAPTPNEAGHKDSQALTIEQVIERVARRGIRIGWKYGKMGGSALQTLRNRGQNGEDELVDSAMQSLGLKGKSGGEVAKIEEPKQSGRFGNIKDTISGYTRRQVKSAADDIQFSQIRDGIAAWVLVKVSGKRTASLKCRLTNPASGPISSAITAVVVADPQDSQDINESVRQVRE
jgi:hypothetical protein